MYRKTYEVVGYAYEAGLHCLDCSRARFGNAIDDDSNPPTDNEGNPVSPVFLDNVTSADCCDECLCQLAD
jgi:hypothetical protein